VTAIKAQGVIVSKYDPNASNKSLQKSTAVQKVEETEAHRGFFALNFSSKVTATPVDVGEAKKALTEAKNSRMGYAAMLTYASYRAAPPSTKSKVTENAGRGRSELNSNPAFRLSLHPKSTPSQKRSEMQGKVEEAQEAQPFMKEKANINT
jgi:hypothetical protein